MSSSPVGGGNIFQKWDKVSENDIQIKFEGAVEDKEASRWMVATNKITGEVRYYTVQIALPENLDPTSQKATEILEKQIPLLKQGLLALDELNQKEISFDANVIKTKDTAGNQKIYQYNQLGNGILKKLAVMYQSIVFGENASQKTSEKETSFSKSEVLKLSRNLTPPNAAESETSSTKTKTQDKEDIQTPRRRERTLSSPSVINADKITSPDDSGSVNRNREAEEAQKAREKADKEKTNELNITDKDDI